MALFMNLCRVSCAQNNLPPPLHCSRAASQTYKAAIQAFLKHGSSIKFRLDVPALTQDGEILA